LLLHLNFNRSFDAGTDISPTKNRTFLVGKAHLIDRACFNGSIWRIGVPESGAGGRAERGDRPSDETSFRRCENSLRPHAALINKLAVRGAPFAQKSLPGTSITTLGFSALVRRFIKTAMKKFPDTNWIAKDGV
jgi:hypothetical protein